MQGNGCFDCVLFDSYLNILKSHYSGCCFIGPTKTDLILASNENSTKEPFKTEFWTKPIKTNLRLEYGDRTFFILKHHNCLNEYSLIESTM